MSVTASSEPSAPAPQVIPDRVCENCGDPIPIIAPNKKRLDKNNVAAKRFCSDKCRSFKYWQEHKREMQQRRKQQVPA